MPPDAFTQSQLEYLLSPLFRRWMRMEAKRQFGALASIPAFSKHPAVRVLTLAVHESWAIRLWLIAWVTALARQPSVNEEAITACMLIIAGGRDGVPAETMVSQEVRDIARAWWSRHVHKLDALPPPPSNSA